MELVAIFIANPWLAILVAGAFAALWRWSGGKMAAAAALAWTAYGGYEYLMFSRILCTGECNIRIDLLFVYPMLFLTSLLAVVLAIRARAVRLRPAK